MLSPVYMKMDSKAMICFFLFFTIGFSSVSDGRTCITGSQCATYSTKSSYRFGGYLDGCGKANTTGRCSNQVGNVDACDKKGGALPPRLVTFSQGSGITAPKKIICYGFENNMFGCRNRGSCHPHRVVCRSFDDKPAIPPMLSKTLKEKNFHEVDAGGEINITCTAAHALDYRWKITTSKGETYNDSNPLRIKKASFEDQGIYVCYAYGSRHVDVSEPQVVVVKGYLQFAVDITPIDDNLKNLVENISNALENVFFDVLGKVGDRRLNVFKFLGNTTTPPEAYDLLNTTLWNIWKNYVIINIGYCPGETHNKGNGELTFPATLVGAIAKSSEISLTSTTVQRATRRCNGDYINDPHWEEPIITNVIKDAEQNISTSIENLEKNIGEQNISKGNASYVADVLKNVTESDELDTEHIEVVVNILHKLVMAENISETVTISIVTTVNNLVETSESNKTDARLSSNASASLLETFEQQIDNVRDSGNTFNFTSTTIEVYIIQVIDVNVRVIYRTFFIGHDVRHVDLDTEIFELDSEDGGSEYEGLDDDGNSEGNDSRNSEDEGGNSDNGQTNYDDEEEQSTNATVVELDRSAIDRVNNETNGTNALPISFLLHRSTALFNGSLNKDERINSLIVSASVNGVVRNLPDESNILTSFHPIERHRCAKPSCVYWDTSTGKWSTDGCQMVQSQGVDSQYNCRCNHLTNFAVLLDVKGDINNEILDYLTVIGCIVSVWCILLTIFSYLGIKKLRTSRPQQIVLNICLALLGLYLSFLTGIEQAHNHILCVIFGALIHFFTLASVTWMSVEATNMYLLFVKVFNTQISHFMIKASLIGWGIPAVIVLISAIVSPDTYSNCKYCFPDSGSIIFYVSVLSVVVILLTYNLVIFVLVTRKLTCARAKMTNRNVSRQETFRRLQNAVAISVLLGVTWIFGLLAVGAARFFFNFLFCLTNSFQGCCIFLLFCVRQQEVRSAWMTWLRLSFSRVGPTSTTTTTGTDGVSKGKTTSGEKSTSGVNSRSKMELSNVKNVSEVSVAEDPLNVYAEVGEASYDEVKATPNLKTGPTIYHGYTELDARHRVLPPLPEEAEYTKRINSPVNPQAYMEIGETPTLFNKRNGDQTKAGKKTDSTKSSTSSMKAYGFVDYTAGTLLHDANVRPTSEFFSASTSKKSKGNSKDNTRRFFSTKS